jgi:hypothetical protein
VIGAAFVLSIFVMMTSGVDFIKKVFTKISSKIKSVLKRESEEQIEE